MVRQLQWKNSVETTKVILQGGGEHARVVLDCLLSQGREVLALFDPKYSGELFGVQQRGQYDKTFAPDAHAIIAIGNNEVRKKVAAVTAHSFTNAIHPSAVISPFSRFGSGNMILHGSIIQPQAQLGNHIIVNTGAQIDHDCIINDYVHLAPGVVLCGTVQIGEGAFVGAGAVIIPGVKIGAWATVGAGAVVIRDVSSGARVVGNPARPIQSPKSK